MLDDGKKIKAGFAYTDIMSVTLEFTQDIENIKIIPCVGEPSGQYYLPQRGLRNYQDIDSQNHSS